MAGENDQKETQKETTGKGFILEVCEERHASLDKDLGRVKDDIKELKKERKENHEELKKLINDTCENLKNKIVLSEKSTGDKIDKLGKDAEEFAEEIRGKGNDPGIWEIARGTNLKVNVALVIIVVIVILTLGGNWEGVTFETVKDKIKRAFRIGKNQETKQVMPAPEAPIKEKGET